MKKTMLIGLVVLTSFAAYSQAPRMMDASKEPTSFLGVKLGAPMSDSFPECTPTSTEVCWILTHSQEGMKRLVRGKCSNNPNLECMNELPGVEGKFRDYHLKNNPGWPYIRISEVNDKVGQVYGSFPVPYDLQLAQQLVAKFGEPNTGKIPSERMRQGQSYTHMELGWTGPSTQIVYDNHGSSLGNEGCVQVTTQEYLKVMR